MILGALALIAANAATVLGARAILRRVSSGRPAPDAVLFLLLRLLLISAAVLVAGLTGTLQALWLGIAGLLACVVLVARGYHRDLPRLPLPWKPAFLLLAVVVILRLLWQVWFFAPYYGDVLSYHLPKVAEWVQAGAFTREMGSDPRATFPAGFELLEAWWTVFLRHDVLIEMAGLEFLLLAAASAYALAREFGWSSSCAMGAALTVALIPGLHLQATSCMNDGAVAGVLAAAAALIAARVHPGLIVAAVGLGVGIKPTFAFALPGLALFMAWSRKDPAAAPPSVPAALIVGGLGLLVGSFWYLRNLAWFGNPIHPMGTAGMASLTGLPLQSFGPSLRSLSENLRSLIDVRVYDHIAAPSASHAGIANWGAGAFAVGFPALLFLCRSDARLRRLAVSAALAGICVLSSVLMDLYSARFVLFVPIVAGLALARLAELHRFALPLAALAVLLQFATTFAPAELDGAARERLRHRSWKERTAMPAPVEASEGRPIGYLSDYAGTPYWLYGPDYSRRVVYLRENALETLDRHRVRVVYVGMLGERGRTLEQQIRGRGIVVR